MRPRIRINGKHHRTAMGMLWKLADFWGYLWTCLSSEKKRESVELFWSETWKLKDDKQLNEDHAKFCTIFLGNKEETPSPMNPSVMVNWKRSLDLMHEDRNPTQPFTPYGSLSASVLMSMPGLRAIYSCQHPSLESDEVQLQYVRLEHWLMEVKIPLRHSRTPSIAFGVTPQWREFSVPCEMVVKADLDKGYSSVKAMNFVVGLKREAPSLSFAFNIVRSVSEELQDDNVTEKDKVETQATASCEVKTPRLSANASWDDNMLKCSFEQNDGGLSYTSTAHINFKDAKKNVCSVGLGKKLDEHRGIRVVLDTHNTTAITYSHRVDKKFTLEVSATVKARNIFGSHVSVSFTFA